MANVKAGKDYIKKIMKESSSEPEDFPVFETIIQMLDAMDTPEDTDWTFDARMNNILNSLSSIESRLIALEKAYSLERLDGVEKSIERLEERVRIAGKVIFKKPVTDEKKTIQDVTYDDVLLATMCDKPSDVKTEQTIIVKGFLQGNTIFLYYWTKAVVWRARPRYV